MKKIMIVLIIIAALIAALLVANGIYCDNNIKVNGYTVKNTKSDAELRFVLLADLHNKQFGENNCDLIKTVGEQNPDFIAVCGDMIVRGNTDTSVMTSVLKQLSCIAPTYFCLGNHERDTENEIDFASVIAPTGAVFLDNKSTVFSNNGKTVLIGGLSDYPYSELNTAERDFWEAFCAKSENTFSILLHHQPEYIAKHLRENKIDAVVCGHTHGGQIQVPFIGGLIAPSQGLFPKYDMGEYDFDGTKMIVTSGLGNNVIIPRINNQVEICVIDVTT